MGDGQLLCQGGEASLPSRPRRIWLTGVLVCPGTLLPRGEKELLRGEGDTWVLLKMGRGCAH